MFIVHFALSSSAHIPTVKTTRYGLNSFRYYASKTWNELSDHYRKETSFNRFKSLINSFGMAAHATAACVRDFKLFSYFFALYVATFYVFHLYPCFLFTHIDIYAFKLCWCYCCVLIAFTF